MRLIATVLSLIIFFAAENLTFASAGRAISVSGIVLVRNENLKLPKMQSLKPGDTIEKGSVINTSSNGAVKILFSDKSIIDLGASTLFKVDEYNLKNEADREVGMSLPYGKIRASVNVPVSARGKFTIRTKAATMGVRGTEFVILSDLGDFVQPAAPVAKASNSSSPGNTTAEAKAAPPPKPTAGKMQITVIQGKVEVSEKSTPNKSVALTQGTQLTTSNAERKTASDTDTKNEPKPEPPKIVKLSVEEVKAVQQEAKQQDQTFVQAVAIDKSISGSSSSSSNDTLIAFSESFVLPADYVPSINEMGFIGTFSASDMLRQSVYTTKVPTGAGVHLRVVFKR